jgi:hypothetical protein
VLSIYISCHFNCDNKNYVYLAYPILHRNILNQELLGHYLFCCTKCMKRFKEECTFIENGYIYCKEIKDIPHDYCNYLMMEKVEEHKKKIRLTQTNLS